MSTAQTDAERLEASVKGINPLQENEVEEAEEVPEELDSDETFEEPEQSQSDQLTFDYIKQKALRGEALTPEEADLIESGYKILTDHYNTESTYAKILEEQQTAEQQRQAENRSKQWRADVMTRYREAIELGDDAAAKRIQAEIEQGPPQEAQPLSPREQAYLREWQRTRPWAQNDNPMQPYALQQLIALRDHPSLQGADIPMLLNTLDQVMTAQMESPNIHNIEEPKPIPQKKAQQKPRTPKQSNVTALDQMQRNVAHRLFPKLEPKQAETKYAASLEKLKKLGKA